jgi:hypothetical protein
LPAPIPTSLTSAAPRRAADHAVAPTRAARRPLLAPRRAADHAVALLLSRWRPASSRSSCLLLLLCPVLLRLLLLLLFSSCGACHSHLFRRG